MPDSSDQSWPLSRKIWLSVFHIVMAVAACAIGGMLAYDAIQFGDYHPELWVGILASLLGLYALATALSIWNDSRPVYWAMGIAMMVAGLGALPAGMLVEMSSTEQLLTTLRLVVFSISTGVVLTGISMIWWNEKHATIYCRFRMHFSGVILDAIVALGLIWVLSTWETREQGEIRRTLSLTFLGLQIVWLVTLIAAMRRFPRLPNNPEGESTCHR